MPTIADLDRQIADLQAQRDELAKPEPPTKPIIHRVVLTPGASTEAREMYRYGMDCELDKLPEGSELHVTVSWQRSGSSGKLRVEGAEGATFERRGSALASTASKALSPMARRIAGRTFVLGCPADLVDGTHDGGEAVPLIVRMPPKGCRVWLEE